MSMRNLAMLALLATALHAQQKPQLGRPLTADEIKQIDITVLPDGTGLPAGKGTVAQGSAIFTEKCQVCHGPAGHDGPKDRLTGGLGTLATPQPIKTVASYWPSSTTLFDYIRRAMPLTAPQSLTNDEVYSLTAYILSVDTIVAQDAVLDATTLPKVKMPNSKGFERWWPVPPAQAMQKASAKR
jgi:mono/diheme cytochrome c family protein